MLSESMVLDVWNRWSLIGIQITIKTLSSWLYKLVSMDPTPRLCDSSSYCCSVTEKHTCSGVSPCYGGGHGPPARSQAQEGPQMSSFIFIIKHWARMIEYSHFYNIGVMKNLSVVPLSLRIRIRAMWNCIENIKGIPIWIKFLSTSILYNPLELHLNGSFFG